MRRLALSAVTVDEWVARARRLQPQSPRGRQITFAVATLLFTSAMVVAWQQRPDDLKIDWAPVVLAAVVGVPALFALNAVEYSVSARLLGTRVPWADTLTVAVAGRAANLLPLPGAALVRLQALAADGSSYKRAAGATTLVAVAWLGTAALVGAVAAASAGTGWLALALAATGLLAVGVTRASVGRLQSRQEPLASSTLLTVELFAVETAMIIVRALRFWLIIVGFNLGGSIQTAFVLPVAGVLSSALGVFPSGLGIRELLAGALSGANGDAASVGVLASGLDRLIALPVLLLLTLGVGIWLRSRDGEHR